MGQFTYYLAISLDGYLARQDGSVDWLNPYQSKLTSPYDYEEFYKTVSHVIMGRKTWEVAQSFEPRPYHDRPAFVCSRSLQGASLPDYVTQIPSLTAEALKGLRSAAKGRIWIVGGAQLAAEVLKLNKLDEIILTVVPVTLGSGIPWLGHHTLTTGWELSEVHPCELGLLQLVYKRKA